MKRILFLADNLVSGGGQRQMVTVAKLLKSAGYDVSFYCYSKEDFFAHLLEEAHIPIVWQIEKNAMRRMIKVRRFIRSQKFDCVISFLRTPNFLNDFAAIGCHSWKVITGERSAKLSTFNSTRGKVFAWFQRFSDTIVCNSNNAAKLWSDHYSAYKNKLSVIYNCVLLGAVETDYVIKENGKLHIIVAATYQYLKNPIGLIKALCLMTPKEQSLIEIDWFGREEITKGDTRAYDEACSLIAENNLQQVLHLHGETKELASVMNKADVVMLLSSVEGLPNAICEGMLMGKAIIMSKVSDYETLVLPSNGFLCDWDNPQSIKEAILSAANLSEEELISYGKSSSSLAQELFSEKTITERWKQIIES